MKTDKSIYNITIAAIKRSSQNPETWIYSKIVTDSTIDGFDLIENELPVFMIDSVTTKTLITTRRIIEISANKNQSISIDEIDDIIYGNFKGQINKPILSIFKIIDFYGDELHFQMETGAASIGLIYALNTVKKLIRT